MRAKDEVVSIPVGMQKFFGGSGEMVRPSVATVVALVSQIPAGRVATIEALRDRIARRHKVYATCPAATMKAITEAIESKEQFCYWRLVKKGGQVIAQFPGGVSQHKKLLQKEGFSLDESKKVPVVEDLAGKLHVFK